MPIPRINRKPRRCPLRRAEIRPVSSHLGGRSRDQPRLREERAVARSVTIEGATVAGAGNAGLLPIAVIDEPLLMAQIAACVRFWTRILRRIALTWTFTVASAISILRAIDLLDSPAI